MPLQRRNYQKKIFLFSLGHGRFGKGTEYHVFNLAANTHQLHYWRLTNQLRNNWDLAKEVFEQMNVEYTAVMRRFSSQVRDF